MAVIHSSGVILMTVDCAKYVRQAYLVSGCSRGGCNCWYAPRLVDELMEFGHQVLEDELDSAVGVSSKDTPHMNCTRTGWV